jgi:quinol monooxygenase YgiN
VKEEVLFMAVAFIFEVAGLTQAQYEAVVREANAGQSSAGGLAHLAGPSESGWRIIDVWESEEAGNAFYQSNAFQQAIQRNNVASGPPTIWPLHALNK